eukprot:COSAG04_NODE_155_length_22379_cov_5.613707_5_plen_222_part_00
MSSGPAPRAESVHTVCPKAPRGVWGRARRGGRGRGCWGLTWAWGCWPWRWRRPAPPRRPRPWPGSPAAAAAPPAPAPPSPPRTARSSCPLPHTDSRMVSVAGRGGPGGSEGGGAGGGRQESPRVGALAAARRRRPSRPTKPDGLRSLRCACSPAPAKDCNKQRSTTPTLPLPGEPRSSASGTSQPTYLRHQQAHVGLRPRPRPGCERGRAASLSRCRRSAC